MSLVGTTVSHFEIVEELGGGAMGVVYKAYDRNLDRPVALKFLPPHLSRSEDSKARLVREAKAASTLDHPHICTVHEIGETEDGRIFVAMAFYEGETLKKKIERVPLAIEQAVLIAIQTAEGLAEAHRHGILHRDVKPANVMVTDDGQVKIVDFGLAKAAGQATLTRTGTILGTPAYMSPEQVRGERPDARTDIWSLGAVLYEMATGGPPFGGEYEQAVIYSVLHEEPPPMRSRAGDVPEEFERIVAKALAKDREERYADAEWMAADLRILRRSLGPTTESSGLEMRPKRLRRPSSRILAASLVVLAVTALVVWHIAGPFFGSRPPPVETPTIRALAVLPLANQTGDPEQQWFVDGMTDQLIATLSQVPELKITSRTSAMAYKDERKPIQEIAEALGVDFVIDGSVMREGDRVRITVQLVDVPNDRNIWSQQYDRRLRDILALHSDVAQAVVQEIAVTLDPEVTARLTRKVQVDEEAYLAYLRGRAHFAKWTDADWKQAIRYYEEAVSLAPDFGRAYAALSEVYGLVGTGLGLMPWRDAVAKGRVAAVKAIELDPTLADAHTALAQVYMREWNWPAAEEEFRRAIELNPNHTQARQFYATLLLHLQRVDEAMAEARKAAELRPDDASLQCLVAGTLFSAKRYQEAMAQWERVLEKHPGFGMAHYSLGYGHTLSGRYDEAIAEATKSLVLMGERFTSPKVVMACAYAWSGRRMQALALLREIEGRYTSSEEVPAAMIGTMYHCLGEEETALEWLERSYEHRDPFLPILASDPWMDGLRDHPRFQALLKKMGLPLDSPADDS